MKPRLSEASPRQLNSSRLTKTCCPIELGGGTVAQGFRSVAHLVQYKLHSSHAETASVLNNAPGPDDDLDDINDMPF